MTKEFIAIISEWLYAFNHSNPYNAIPIYNKMGNYLLNESKYANYILFSEQKGYVTYPEELIDTCTSKEVSMIIEIVASLNEFNQLINHFKKWN